VTKASRYYQGLDGPAYDPAQAKSLLQQVKTEKGWDGSLTLVCGDTPTQADLALVIQGLLDAAGFQIKIETLSSGALIQRIVFDRNYQIGCLGTGINEENPWVQLVRNYRSDSTFNYTGYANADFDAGLDQLKASATLDQQKAALAKLQKVWNDTVPVANLAAGERYIVHAPSVHGLDFTVKAITMFGGAYVSS
jgi:peptide/nickel transport system substrate-binding protein